MPKLPIGPDGKYRYPRLSREQLRAIYERNPCAEVRELLWEIHRLRNLVLRACQLQRTIGGGCYTSTRQIAERLGKELESEPCVEEHAAWTAGVLGYGSGSPYARRKDKPE